jgi:hypothetical protein
METDLVTIDSAFTNQYKGLLDIQKDIKAQLDTYLFDLSKTEITDAIIARMDAFWYFNVSNNKQILDRKTNTTAADFFTETCLLFLKSYFEKDSQIKVLSEKNITKGSVIRPDISIWKDGQLIAAIELKVSDGWKGGTMLPHLIDREAKIKSLFPNAYFGVIAFWNFFYTEMEGWNSKYFGIKQWNEKEDHPKTGAYIENLIKEIKKIR